MRAQSLGERSYWEFNFLSAKHEARGSKATNNASAKHEARRSEVTKNASAKPEGAKRLSRRSGLAFSHFYAFQRHFDSIETHFFFGKFLWAQSAKRSWAKRARCHVSRKLEGAKRPRMWAQSAKAWDSEATEIVSAKHKVWGSEVTDYVINASAMTKSERAKQSRVWVLSCKEQSDLECECEARSLREQSDWECEHKARSPIERIDHECERKAWRPREQSDREWECKAQSVSESKVFVLFCFFKEKVI